MTRTETWLVVGLSAATLTMAGLLISDTFLALVLVGAELLAVGVVAVVRSRGSRQGWLTAGIGLSLLAGMGLVWAVPTVQGPRVECVNVGAVECDTTWRRDARNVYAIQGFPVTYARVEGSVCANPQTIYLEALGGLLKGDISWYCAQQGAR